MIKNQQPCPIVDENERSLRFEYRFRRYGIIVLSLIILTALSGLWSSGYQEMPPDSHCAYSRIFPTSSLPLVRNN
ncbi:TPA: hypothetical protein MI822_00590 [Klebsiella pneumoniae]|nr:hypothetical protein H232_0388 [Klebsiella pneumoniae UHKPC81]HBY8015808.1 hypothetical protein [Klebsiella pneumoniae]